MNILYIPQLSMYDKSTSRFIPEADGNLNMMKNFTREWLNSRNHDNFVWLLPFTSEVQRWFGNSGFSIPEVYVRFYKEYVVSARINRFNFPMADIERAIKSIDGKIDLVICDVPELARNIIAMFEVNFGYSPKIMSNIHHMDDITDQQTKYNYFLRVFDAIECSDFVTILSSSMKDMLDKAMMEYFSVFKRLVLMSKVFVFEPSVSYKEISQINKQYHYKENEKKIITFPGRLSIGEENRTNWDKFLDAIQILRDSIRDDFEVYLTDPNNSANFDKQPEWLHFIDKDRDQFLKLLHKTDIIVSLMAIQGFGGISIREALQFGCMPVIPYVGEYKQMKPEFYEGFITGKITVDKIVCGLNFALSNADYYKQYLKKFSIIDAYKFTIESQMPKLLTHMEGILNG